MTDLITDEKLAAVTHQSRHPQKTTPTDFLLWWAQNWDTADKTDVAFELDKLTDTGRETLTLLTRAMTWTNRPPIA